MDWVFVYGTLRRDGFYHDVIRPFIADWEPGVIHGQLYDGGDYPYLVLPQGTGATSGGGDHANTIVVGEWVQLRSDTIVRALAALDELEDYRPDDPASEYLRVTVQDVRTDRVGFAYVAGPIVQVHALSQIPSGDWLQHLATR